MREEILKLHEQGLSYREIATKLGKSKSLVSFYIRTKNGDWDTKKKEKETKDKEFHELVISLIKESDNFNQVCNKLNYRPTNANYDRLKKIVNLYNVDISHFTSLSTPVGKLKKYSIEEIFCENTQASKSLIMRTLRSIRPHKCEGCQRTEWDVNGVSYPIPLQVHHINGNRKDNRLENLKLICPNCHYFTDNFAGKNINHSKKEEKVCPKCNKSFIPISNTQIYCSKQCSHASKKMIPKSILEELINDKSISQISKIYHVTPKTIRTWCKKYNIDWKSIR